MEHLLKGFNGIDETPLSAAFIKAFRHTISDGIISAIHSKHATVY